MTGKEEAFWIGAVGTVCASALSIKFTALAAPGLVAMESFSAIFFLKRSVKFTTMLAIGAVMVVQFMLWYYIHFSYLPLSGEHGDGFMPIEFQRTLINNTYYDVRTVPRCSPSPTPSHTASLATAGSPVREFPVARVRAEPGND